MRTRNLKTMKQKVVFILLTVFTICNANAEKLQKKNTEKDDLRGWNDEIIYHVIPRSFYDSNGDLHGDLNGFVSKLDYLQDLGVTAILFTPLYESGFYHNYFPTDYQKIDEEYGTLSDYLNFVREVHKRGMKFLMDMETQYAQSGNTWFDDSYKNPSSKYSGFICYSDSANCYPEQIFLPSRSPLTGFKAWPGNQFNIVYLNLNNIEVKKWMIDFYAFWADPDKNGSFEDGVDGFRIDHIMDDLDNKGIFTDMYANFWKPLFTKCRQINPQLFILGEQANWAEYGDEMVKKSGADAAFGFPLKFALASEKETSDLYRTTTKKTVSFNPDRIHEVVTETMKRFTNNTYSVSFIENHDTERWASVVDENEGKMEVAAVLNILLPGVPLIYYGQELGMTGKVGNWGYDVNHIPVREAFPWSADYNMKGMAVWYKDSGEWWDQSVYKTGKVQKMALPGQKGNSNSLFNLYKSLIAIRKSENVFISGDYSFNKSLDLIDFTRTFKNEKVRVILNISDKNQEIEVGPSQQSLLVRNSEMKNNRISLKSFGFVILKQE